MRTPTSRWVGLAWLGLGAPVGALAFFVSLLSDHASERRLGLAFLVLGVLSALLGFQLLRGGSRSSRTASFVLSALWLGAGLVAASAADFAADRVLFGGVPGVVAAVTVLLAAAWRPVAADRSDRPLSG